MRYATLLFFLLSFLSLSAQEGLTLYKGKKAPNVRIVEMQDSTGFDPFKVAERVELLFYTRDRMSWNEKPGKNPEEIIINGNLNIPVDSIAGKVILDSAQSSDWQSTLYKSQLCEELMVAGCYEPRHLLVFYGDDNSVIGAIEICVSCAGAWISKGLRRFVVCPNRMSILESMATRIARENNIISVHAKKRNRK